MRQWRSWPAAPLLIGIYPVLYLFSANVGRVNPGVMTYPLILSAAAALAFNALAAAYAQDWRRGALLVDVFLLSCYTTSSLIDLFCPWIYGSPWSKLLNAGILAAIVALCRFLNRPLKNPTVTDRWTTAANVCGMILIAAPLSMIGWHHATETRSQHPISMTPLTALASDSPDVYYIILDGYARADIFARDLNYDNSPFIEFLKKKGFFVAGKSRSNYAYTQLSLASSLNMGYLNELNKASNQQTECLNRIRDNNVFRFFQSKGYETHYLESGGFEFIDERSAAGQPSFHVVNDFENLILKKFLWRAFIKRQLVNIYKSRILAIFDRLEQIPLNPKPTFCFVHILCPHPPYVFDREGKTPKPTIYKSRPPGSRDWHPKERYVDQVDYLNRLVERAVTRLLEKTKNSPVIILQGDHGAACDGTSSNPTELMVRERMSILNAFYVPPGLTAQLYPSITPVNTFRLLGNYLFHAHFSRLPDRSYYSGPMDAVPYEFMDVRTWLADNE